MELKQLGRLLLGFVPWLLFLFLAGRTLGSLELAAVLCLAVSLIGMRFQTRKQGHDLGFKRDKIQSEGIVNLHGPQTAPALPVGARQIS